MSQDDLAELIKVYYLKNEELNNAKLNLQACKISDPHGYFDKYYKNLNSPSPLVLTWQEAEKLKMYSEEKESYINKIEELEGSLHKIKQNIIDNLPVHNVFIEIMIDSQKHYIRYNPESGSLGSTKNGLVITTELEK